MSEPVRASNTPFAVDVQEGKSYFWCACGKSQKQPFCDGAHSGSEFTPVKYQADKTGQLYFCGCKATAAQPLCDGSHKN